MHKKISLALLVLAFAFFVSPQISHAQSSPSATNANMLMGWAWSSNIGWVSFNCANFGTCLQGDKYKVEIMPDGTLVGDAWSSNIGWIHFGNMSGFPIGKGTSQANASFDGSAFTGWARALSNGGGWDGWISLSGKTTSVVTIDNSPLVATTPTAASVSQSNQGSYGVTATGNTASGFAWGSDVIGWLSFSGPGYSVSIVPNDPSTDDTVLASSTDCYGPDGSLIKDGDSKMYFHYSSEDAYLGQSCSDTQNRICSAGFLSGSYSNTSCSGRSINSFQTGVAPQVDLLIGRDGIPYVHTPLVVSKGADVNVKWIVSPDGGQPDICVGTGGLAGQVNAPASGSFRAASLQTSTTYTITCSNAYGTSTDSVKAVIYSVNEF